MAAPKYLHPHVSSAITDLSQVFITAPGSTMLYCVSSADRGPDNTPTLITSESEFTYYFGEPNMKKHGQAMYNAINWLRSGGTVVFTRVLPYKMVVNSSDYRIGLQGATYAALVIEAGLQVQPGTNNLAVNRDDKIDRHYAIRTRTPGGEYQKLSVPFNSSDAPRITSGSKTNAKNIEKAIRTESSLNTNLIKTPTFTTADPLSNFDVSYVYESVWAENSPGTNIVGDGSNNLQGGTLITNANKATHVTPYYGADANYKIVDSNNNLELSYIWYPLIYFRGKYRGEYYNNFGVTLTLRSTDDETYDFRTYDLTVHKNASTTLEGPFVVSFYPEATDNSGASLFIEDVVNTYSTLISCKMNENVYDDLCEYISGVGSSGDTSVYKKIDVLTLEERDVNPKEVVHKAAKNAVLTKPFEITGTTSLTPNAVLVLDEDTSNKIQLNSTGKFINRIPNRDTTSDPNVVDNGTKGAIYSGLRNTDIDSLAAYSPSTVLKGGTDGTWGRVDTSIVADSMANSEKNTLITQAYDGKTADIDNDEIFFSEIKKKDKFPIDVILDSNHNSDIKNAINKLATTRGDCVSFVDVGYTASPKQALDQRSGSGTLTVNFNTYHTSIFVQDFVVFDSFTGRDIRVTPTYFLAEKIPSNDDTFGMHIPFVGPRRGTITGFKEMSWAPDDENKELLYKAKLNYVEFDEARGLSAFMMQTTSQLINSSLSDINHVRTLLRIRRDVENMMKDYRFETEGSPSWGNLQYSLNNYLEQYKTNGALNTVSAALVASDYDLKQRLMRVQIQMQFSAVIERLFADITVQR